MSCLTVISLQQPQVYMVGFSSCWQLSQPHLISCCCQLICERRQIARCIIQRRDYLLNTPRAVPCRALPGHGRGSSDRV